MHFSHQLRRCQKPMKANHRETNKMKGEGEMTNSTENSKAKKKPFHILHSAAYFNVRKIHFALTSAF